MSLLMAYRVIGESESTSSRLCPGAIAGWVIQDGIENRAVVIGGRELLSLEQRWLVSPQSITQLGVTPTASPRYGRIVAGYYHLGAVSNAIAISRTLFAPISQKPGFCGTVVSVDFTTGETFSISLWETKDHAFANVTDGWYEKQVRRFDQCYVSPPSAFGGSVVDIL